jgi:iron complex transport system substrate-binding protein
MPPLSQNVPMPRAWLLLFLGLLLAGCQPKITSVGGKTYSPPQYVVSLSPSTTEILATNGNNGQLRGRTQYCNYPSYITTSPEIKVYGAVKPDYEKITGDKPSLIVYEKALYSDAEVAKLKSLGIQVFEFHSKTIDEYITQLKEFGDVLGSALTMSSYVDKINSERRLAITRAPANHPKIAAVSGSMINGTKTFLSEVIRTAGGEPAGPDADRFVQMNPEALIQSNPDIIFLTVDIAPFAQDKPKQTKISLEAVNKFLADARYKGIKAVKTRAVFPVDADVMLRQGTRVDALIAGVSQVVQNVAGN